MAALTPDASATLRHLSLRYHEFNSPDHLNPAERQVWLGIFEPKPVGRAHATPAQLLEHLLAEKWQLQPHDRDLIVMQHRFDYERAGRAYRLTSSLAVLGDDATHTGMAKTVGLPLGMAVRRLVRGELAGRGVVIPTAPELYEPILQELAADYGINFHEEEMLVGEFAA